MSDSLAITLRASSEATASGSGAAVDLWDADDGDGVQTRRFVEVALAVTAVDGTLVVSVETSNDGSTSWKQAGAFTARTTTAVQTLTLGDFKRYIRCTWTLGDGETATFAVAGTALETFCTLAQLASLGSARATIATVPAADRIDHLVAATSIAHGYIRKRHTPPIISVGHDVAQAVAKIAALSLLTDGKGINPHTEATALVLEEARGKERWLRDVSNGIAGADVVDSTPETPDGVGAVETETSMGWDGMSVL